jgi:hypothetical protein
MDSSDTRLAGANPPAEWAHSDYPFTPPNFFAGNAAILATFSAGGTPALPGD